MRRSAELLLFALLLVGCAADPVPKPRGFFRIDLPQAEFKTWSDSGSFSTELPVYSRIGRRPAQNGARWYDLRFKDQRATVHLTWSPVKGQLGELIEDAHLFKNTHEAKAVKITNERVLRDSARVFGTVFHVEGDVASPLVFYLTDSTDNFLYGALYFDTRPNADSLAPVTARIRSDVQHMANTLSWH